MAIRLPLTCAIADVVRALKSESAVVLARSMRDPAFRWQTGYAAISVDPDRAEGLLEYVEHQRDHRRHGATVARWERIDGDTKTTE